MLEPIDNYCERTDASLLSEPLNAVTNLAFIIASYYLIRLYRHHNCHNPIALALAIVVALVGIGSALFHTFGNRLTMMMDIFPIMIFVFTYLWAALRQFFGLNRAYTAGLLALFFLISSQSENVPYPYDINGSIAYVPCLLALLLMGVVQKNKAIAKALLAAAALFTVSLTLRSLDMALCDTIPFGTHLWWHCLNGVVLYLLTRALIIHRQPPN